MDDNNDTSSDTPSEKTTGENSTDSPESAPGSSSSESESSSDKKRSKDKSALGFANFLERASAFVFDFGLVSLLFNALLWCLDSFYDYHIFKAVVGVPEQDQMQAVVVSFAASILIWLFLNILFSWLYFALLESSKKRATIGKLLVGLYLGDEHLKPLSFKKASVRHFGKLLSFSVFGVGFLLALISERKQALHDFLAKTYVLRGDRTSDNRTTLVFFIGFILLSSSVFFLKFKETTPEEEKPKEIIGAVSIEPVARNSMIEGFFQIGDEQLTIKDIVSIYDPLHERFEFYFFRTPILRSDREKLEKKADPTHILALAPTFIAEFGAERGALKCDKDKLRYHQFTNNLEVIELAETEGAKTVIRFDCELVRGSKIKIHFVKNAEADSPQAWNLEGETPLLYRPAEGNLEFNSQDAEGVAALWSVSDQNIQMIRIGFFENFVSPEEREILRGQKSLFGIKDKPPIFSVTVELQPDAQQFVAGSVIKYGVSFHRNDKSGFVFPGLEDTVSLFYVPSVTENLQLAKLEGTLKERESIQALLTHSAEKTIADVAFDLRWNAQFNTALIDLALEAKEIASLEAQKDLISGKERCRVISDGEEVSLEHSLGLYYPDERDIVVGFYFEPLTEEERAEVRKNRLIWPYVNGKRPSVVVFFDFKRTASEPSLDNLASYSVFLLRDRHGRLYFPGSHDRVQFRKVDVELNDGEIAQLLGEFRDGGRIKFINKSQRTSKRSGLTFAWDIKADVPIVNVDAVKLEPKKADKE